MTEPLGKQIRKLREARGMSREALSRHSRVGSFWLVNYELGVATPTLDGLERIAQALDARLEIRLVPYEEGE